MLMLKFCYAFSYIFDIMRTPDELNTPRGAGMAGWDCVPYDTDPYTWSG